LDIVLLIFFLTPSFKIKTAASFRTAAAFSKKAFPSPAKTAGIGLAAAADDDDDVGIGINAVDDDDGDGDCRRFDGMDS